MVDFKIVGGVGSRARRSGKLVADVDEQLRSNRLAAAQRDSRSRIHPTPMGDGTTMGGEADDGGRGRDGEGLSQSLVRVFSAARELPRKLLFCFLKPQFSPFQKK